MSIRSGKHWMSSRRLPLISVVIVIIVLSGWAWWSSTPRPQREQVGPFVQITTLPAPSSSSNLSLGPTTLSTSATQASTGPSSRGSLSNSRLAPSHPSPVTTRSAPRQAAQAGFTRAHLNDDFTTTDSIDLADRCPQGLTWYRARPFGWPTLGTSEFRVNQGVLTFTQSRDYANWGLSTTCARNGHGQHFTFGYFEARLRFNPSTPSAIASTGWPSFWSMSKQHIDGTKNDRWAEIDFFEAYHSPGQRSPHDFVGTLHDWIGHWPDPNEDFGSYGNHIASLGEVDFSSWHTYGCLWKPGEISWYFDDTLVLRQQYSPTGYPVPNPRGNPVGTFSSFDTQAQGMTVVLGSGAGYPLDVDWVRVWGR